MSSRRDDSAVIALPDAYIEADGGRWPMAPDSALEHDVEYDTIWSDTAVKADLRWVFEHGDHTHRWVGDDARKATVGGATRVARHVECDGSCGGVCQGEGYHVTVWVCDTTGEDLTPGTLPDPVMHVKSAETYTFTLAGPDLPEKIEGRWKITFEADGKTHIWEMPPARFFPGERLYRHDQPAQVVYSGQIRW